MAGSVSVVIPTKDGSAFLTETLAGVAAQTHVPADVVVVDDGSTDGTTSIVSTFPGVRLLANVGTGSNRARATGVDATSSDYVALLDHDDVWFPDHLAALAGLLDDHPDAVVAYGRQQHARGRVRTRRATRQTGRRVDLWETFPMRPFLGGPSAMVVRRSALEEVGGWPRWDRVPTDVFMAFRLAEAGPFAFWPGVTGAYRLHPASLSQRAARVDLAGLTRSRLDLLHEVLDRHAESRPDAAPRLRARLDELEEILEILLAFLAGDQGRLGALLDRFSERADHSADLLPDFAATLRPLLDSDVGARRAFLRWYASWPREHRDARRLLADPAVAMAVLSGLRRHPLRPRRWGVPVVPELRLVARPLVVGVASTLRARR